MTTTLPPFPAFDITQDQGALGLRWKKYIDRFRNLIVALNIADKKRQRALLLHYAGEDVNDIFETLANTTASGEENPHGILYTKEKRGLRRISVSTSQTRTGREDYGLLHSTQASLTDLRLCRRRPRNQNTDNPALHVYKAKTESPEYTRYNSANTARLRKDPRANRNSGFGSRKSGKRRSQ